MYKNELLSFNLIVGSIYCCVLYDLENKPGMHMFNPFILRDITVCLSVYVFLENSLAFSRKFSCFPSTFYEEKQRVDVGNVPQLESRDVTRRDRG